MKLMTSFAFLFLLGCGAEAPAPVVEKVDLSAEEREIVEGRCAYLAEWSSHQRSDATETYAALEIMIADMHERTDLEQGQKTKSIAGMREMQKFLLEASQYPSDEDALYEVRKQCLAEWGL